MGESGIQNVSPSFHHVPVVLPISCHSETSTSPVQWTGETPECNGSSPATICFHLPAQHLIKYPTKSHALPINIQQKVVTYRYQDVEWRYGLCNPSNLIFIMLI